MQPNPSTTYPTTTLHYRTPSREQPSQISFSSAISFPSSPSPPSPNEKDSALETDALFSPSKHSPYLVVGAGGGGGVSHSSGKRRLPPTPKAWKRLQFSAVLGWTTAGILALVLFLLQASSPTARRTLSELELMGAQVVEDIGFRPSGMQVVPSGGVKSKVTIVSGFYKIESGKKHKVSEYHEWLTNFLHSVELPIVFFCAPSQRQYIADLRGSKPITIVSAYETPFDMPPLQSLGGYEWALSQHRLDPETQVHVPDVYGIWTAKPWIVNEAKEMDPYGSEYFFWADAGAFRDPSFTPSFSKLPLVLDDIFSRLPLSTLLLSAVTVPLSSGTTYVKSATPTSIMDRADILQGGWYGGRKEAVQWWFEETMKTTRLQAGLGRFTAKEQIVWTQTARLNWDRIYVQNMALRTGPDCGPDMWFGFEYFADGRDCHIPAWVGPHYAKLEGKWKDRQWNHTETKWGRRA